MLIFSSRFRELDDLIRRGPFEANAFEFPYDDFVDADFFPGCSKLAKAEEERYGDDAYSYHYPDDYCDTTWNVRKNLLTYINKAKAVHTPVLVMALMIALAKKQGYKVHTSEFDYKRKDEDYITPTVDNVKIPAAYGSTARMFIVLSDFAANSKAISGDSRKGWEYGHSTLLTISRVKGEYVLKNNQEGYASSIKSFPDVDRLVEEYSIDDLAHLIGIDEGKFNFSF